MSIAQILLVGGVLTVGIGVVRATRAMRGLYPQPLPIIDASEEISPSHDGSLPTAVLLCDHAGTEVSDFLLPYQLLTASSAFNVYAVAPEHRPVTLTGGLDVMPDLSFAGLERLPATRPDVVVIPHLTAPDAALLAWVREQARAGAVVLTICTGAGVAAEAGLLDGRRATAHWGDLPAFERRHPDVEWVRGVRYVDDGDICSSAGITSGIDATLHLIRRLAGDEAMDRAANAIGYADRRYLVDPRTDQYRIEPADLVFPLTAAFGRRPHRNVLLRDGVDETSLAAVMDVHAATCTARLTTISADGERVRSRHGLTLVPRTSLEAARPSPTLTPAMPAVRDAARTDAGATARTVTPPGGSFDAFRIAIDDLAQRGRAIARFAAKRLEYRPSDTSTDRRPPRSDHA